MLVGGMGELVCCGIPMVKLEEQTADQTLEKHVPMIEKEGDNVKVTVGSTLHPMMDAHFIEWIELVTTSGTHIHFLKPGDEPVAVFKCVDDVLYAREHCNVHGLWKNTV